MESNLGSVLGPARSSSSAISISLRPQATRIYSRERRLNLTPTHVGHMLIVPWLLGPALLCPSRNGSLHELQARSQVQSALLQFRAVKGFQQEVSGCLINPPTGRSAAVSCVQARESCQKVLGYRVHAVSCHICVGGLYKLVL